MPKLPIIPRKKRIKFFEALGFVKCKQQPDDNYTKMERYIGSTKYVISIPDMEIKTGTLRGIMRQGNILRIEIERMRKYNPYDDLGSIDFNELRY